MGNAMRANLFVFRSANDPWVRRFIEEPDKMLAEIFPKLSRLIGECRVVSKVEAGPVSLYRMDGGLEPGVVLIGDAFQGPCPSTGMGLSKVLTDVDVLTAECLPLWLATAGMGCEKIAAFYNHARKRSVDDLALRTAQYRRRVVRDRSARWYIHRLRLHAEMQFGRPSKPSLSSTRSAVNELPRGAAL
jgi:2-polyprenyl-6-methoxyphenol hydroxylase-like FAD-dependent oxidoreductase